MIDRLEPGKLTTSRDGLHKGLQWRPSCLAEAMMMGQNQGNLIWQFRAVLAWRLPI